LKDKLFKFILLIYFNHWNLKIIEKWYLIEKICKWFLFFSINELHEDEVNWEKERLYRVLKSIFHHNLFYR
jgi:hypothetical protein